MVKLIGADWQPLRCFGENGGREDNKMTWISEHLEGCIVCGGGEESMTPIF